MNSRADILTAVAQGQPALLPLPAPISRPVAPSPSQLVVEFCQRISAVGGVVAEVATMAAVSKYLAAAFPLAGPHFTNLPGLEQWCILGSVVTDARELAAVEVAALSGMFGVAENGAVWVDGQLLPHRALPFICQHLALVLPIQALVPTMHEALGRLAGRVSDYGVFIAGPSKTADIEQSLVIGAHGPRSLTVFLLSDSETPLEPSLL